MAVESRNNLFTADDDCFSEQCMYPDSDIMDMDTEDFIGGDDGDKCILDDVENQPFLLYYRREIWAITVVVHVILAIKVVPYLQRVRTLSNQCYWCLVVSLVLAMMWSMINFVISYIFARVAAREVYYGPIISLVVFATTCLFVVYCDEKAAPYYKHNEDRINEHQE